jgi:2-dehydro-3-deoxyphosphogluconate aldolase/(4S)-4-hydroxy-2-oxoglutarate aldolase
MEKTVSQLSDYHRERVRAVLQSSPLVPVIAIQDLDDAVLLN